MEGDRQGLVRDRVQGRDAGGVRARPTTTMASQRTGGDTDAGRITTSGTATLLPDQDLFGLLYDNYSFSLSWRDCGPACADAGWALGSR